MKKVTLNQRLAENLATLMEKKRISANQLGKLAGLSPRTLANYLKTDHNPTPKGKERSAKLTEVERLAAALGVHPLLLLGEMGSESDSGTGVGLFYTPRHLAAVLQNTLVHGVFDPSKSTADFLQGSIEFLTEQLAQSDQVTRDAVAPLLGRVAIAPEDGARIAATLLAIMRAAKPAKETA